MGFSMLIPVTVEITTPTLAATNVSVSEAAWNSGTSYSSGQVVRRTVDGLYIRFSSLQNSNSNKTPELEPTWWLDEGPVNAHAMFDDTTTTVTTNADSIAVEIEVPAGQRVDTVWLAGLSGESVTVAIEDPTAGEVHNETYSLADAGAITNLWEYFTAEVLRKSEILITDLPNGAGSTLTITVDHPGDAAACGHLVLGQRMALGATKWGVSTEIKDYSRWVENDFGDRVLVEGAYRKLCGAEVIVANGVKDSVERELTRARAQPRLFIADEDYSTLCVFGTCRWRNAMDMAPDHSLLSVQIEGNT